jgi:alpha-mannosidase
VNYNLSSVLEHERVHDRQHVDMRYWSAPLDSKPGFADAVQSLQESTNVYEKGTKLGPSFTNHWIQVSLRIPDSFKTSSEPIICASINVSTGVVAHTS